MKKEEKKQSSLKTKKLKSNSYNAAMLVIVLAIVIVVNLMVSELPAKYIKWDSTDSGVYGITNETKNFVKKLDKDITIYYIAKTGAEDIRIQTMLEKYSNETSHIKVENVDPSVHPTFINQYDADGTAQLIVECGERYKVLTESEMFKNNYAEYYNGTAEEYEETFEGEDEITSAIQYVTTDDLPKMYVLQEHEETPLDDNAKGAVEDNNIRLEDLSLIKNDTVPKDCDALLVVAPQKDLVSSEKDKILDYLKNGGNAIFIMEYSQEAMPNFDEVLKYYNLKLKKGMIVEGDNRHYVQQAPYYIIPEKASSDVTDNIVEKNQSVIMMRAQGIESIEDARDTLNITDVLTTTEKAYMKEGSSDTSNLKQDMSDPTGSFAVGTIVTESEESADGASDADPAEEEEGISDTASEDESKVKTKLAVFTSYALVDSSVDSYFGSSNLSLFLDTVGWMCEYENSIVIPGKLISTDYLTVPSADAFTWSIVYVIVIPVVFVVFGIVICVKRRRKG